MKAALLFFLLGLFLVPLQAEDWALADGKTYQNVQVLSHDAAYVTILHKDGGGRLPLSTLPATLQKRFAYDPAKAAAAIAATAAADKRDKEALAREKSLSDSRAAQGLDDVNQAVAQAALPPPPVDAATPPPGSAPPDDVAVNEGPNYGQSEIDDYDYGYYGGYGGYSGYGYGYGGYGSPGRWTHRYGGGGFTHGTYGGSSSRGGMMSRPGVGGAKFSAPTINGARH